MKLLYYLEVQKVGDCGVKCLLREIGGNGGVFIGPMTLLTLVVPALRRTPLHRINSPERCSLE